MICPHCKHELGDPFAPENGVQRGGQTLPLIPSGSLLSSDPDLKTPKFKGRGKAREYTQAFNIAWKVYGRKEQKFEAFAVWLLRAKEIGGEPQLLTLVLAALKWQSPEWESEGWRFAPYFERYLKRRKWEDEPLPPSNGHTPLPNAIRASRDALSRFVARGTK